MTVHSLMWGPPGWRLPARSGPSTSMSSCAGFALSAPVPVLELLPSHLCHPRAVTPNGGCASENTTLDGGFGVPRSVILQAVPFLIWLH